MADIGRLFPSAQSQPLDMSTFTGADIKAVASIGDRIKVFGELQTLTFSIHREKPSVYLLGNVNPRSFVRGPRCLPATERVLIKDRGYINIDRVNVGDLVQSLPDSYDKVLGVYDQGLKECYHLYLGNGYDIRVSYDHPISTPNGWIEACKLQPGDLVNIAGCSPVSDQDMDIPEWILIMLAYLIGDGTTRIYPKKNGGIEYRISLAIADSQMDTIGAETERILCENKIPFKDSRSRSDKCVSRRISTCIEGFAHTDFRLRQYNDLHRWLLALNHYGRYSYEKSIPQEFISSLSRRQIALFLNRLYSTDGCYSISGNRRYIESSYCSCSEGLIDGIRILLSKLGINSLKHRENKIGKPGGRANIISRHDAYRLIISKASELLKFIRYVNIFSKEDRICELEGLLRSRIKDLSLRVSTKEFRRMVLDVLIQRGIEVGTFMSKYNLYNYKGAITLRKALAVAEELENSDFSDRINTLVDEVIYERPKFIQCPLISSISIGRLPVYDLSVEDNHSFISNFIHVHNTIAGSMIFTVFNREVMEEFLSVYPEDPIDNDFGAILVDQLPPFNISVSFVNEDGYLSSMVIYGVEIVDDGQTMSINDMIIENMKGYKARGIDLMWMTPEGIWSQATTGQKRWMSKALFINTPIGAEVLRLSPDSQIAVDYRATLFQIAQIRDSIDKMEVDIALLDADGAPLGDYGEPINKPSLADELRQKVAISEANIRNLDRSVRQMRVMLNYSSNPQEVNELYGRRS